MPAPDKIHYRTSFAIRDALWSIFFDTLAEDGDVKRAAHIAGMSRPEAMKTIKRRPDLQARFDEALETVVEKLHVEAHRRAVTGVTRPVYYQGQPVYQYRSVIGEDGFPVQENGRDVRELVRDAEGQPVPVLEATYSDSLLTTLLKAHDPRFRDKASVELSGPGGGPVEISQLEVARRLMYAVQRGLIAAQHPGGIEDAQLVEPTDDPGGDLV